MGFVPTDAELKCLWLPDLPVYVKGVTRSFLVLASLLVGCLVARLLRVQYRNCAQRLVAFMVWFLVCGCVAVAVTGSESNAGAQRERTMPCAQAAILC